MEFDVRLGDVRYPLLLGTDWQEFIISRLLALGGSRYLVVCDAHTGPLFAEGLAAQLSRHAPADLLVHPAGEPRKDLAAVGELMESALALGADRGSVVVALGGGITGNVAGLMAALLFRGIRLVHVPTSLIAVLDSVMSLKQAVNASVGKNLVGTFYAPVEVLADTAMLRSLPRRETVSGLCEAVKNALAIRPAMIGLLLRELRPDACYPDAALLSFIRESLLAKASVVVEDERECRAGLVLEFGHTVGHALEHVARGRLSHGEAIGLGMIAAAEISHRLGHLDARAVAMHRRLLERAGAATCVPHGIDLDEVVRRHDFDNKRGDLRGADAGLAMVLLEDYGEPLWLGGRPLVPVPTALVRDVVHETLPHAGGQDDQAPLDAQLLHGAAG